MKVVKMLAAVMAAGMMTGCAASAPGYVDRMEETVAQAVATEPAAAQMQVPVEEPTEVPTVAPTEAAAPFEVGQQVFVVYAHEGGTGLRRFFVVAIEGDSVTVTTAIPGSGEDGDLMTVPVADCYADSADAWVAAGMEPLE